MILFDPGALYTTSLGDDPYILAFFNGPVPATVEDIPFDTSHFDNMVLSENLCGMTMVKGSYLDTSKYTNNDACRLDMYSGNEGFYTVPFGRVEDIGDGEYKYWATDVKWNVDGTDVTKPFSTDFDPSDSMGIVYSTYNMFCACGNQNVNYYTRFTGDAEAANEIENYMEVTVPKRIVLKRIIYGTYKHSSYWYNYRATFDILGYDYELEEWVKIGYIPPSNSVADTNLDVNAPFATDKFRFEIVSKAPIHPILSTLFLISETEPDVGSVDQPTWMAILPHRINLEAFSDRGLPFFWASCSGPTGDGEFKLAKEQFVPGDFIPILTNSFEYEPFWEEAE